MALRKDGRLFVLGRVLGSLISGEPDDGPLRWTHDNARGAVERMILGRKADTPASAAVHAMLFLLLAEDAAAAARRGDVEAVERALWQVERVARSVVDVLVGVAGIEDGDLPIDYFLRPGAALWGGPADAAFDAVMEEMEGAARATLRLPEEPTETALEVIARVGGLGMDRAREVYRGLLAVVVPEPEK